MADFRVLPESVKESITNMKNKIDDITRLRNSLASAISKYKNDFQDEISKMSSELVEKIDAELKVLNELFTQFMQRKDKEMDAIEEWRSYK